MMLKYKNMDDKNKVVIEENLDPRDHRVIGRELDMFTFRTQ